jgi:hypothetical protein
MMRKPSERLPWDLTIMRWQGSVGAHRGVADQARRCRRGGNTTSIVKGAGPGGQARHLSGSATAPRSPR